jgi:hypothetical protein
MISGESTCSIESLIHELPEWSALIEPMARVMRNTLLPKVEDELELTGRLAHSTPVVLERDDFSTPPRDAVTDLPNP